MPTSLRGIPSAWQTKDQQVRDDLRRIRVYLEQLARDLDAVREAGGGGGAGSVTEVDSPDGSIVVTDGTGPTVIVEANFGTGDGEVMEGNQAAGGDASGTLDNLTIPIAHQPESEFWCIPASPDANDVEFVSGSAPSGMVLRNTTDATTPTVSGTPAITRTGVTTTDQLYIDYNVRRSWARFQAPFDSKRYAAYFPITPGTNATFRSRLSFSRENASENNNNPNGFLFVAASSGGFPDFDNYLAVGNVNSDPRVWEMYSISGGAATLRKQDTVLKSDITQEWEFFIVKGGTDYKLGVRAGGSFLILPAFTWSPTIAYWGVAFSNSSTFNVGQMNPIVGCDYLRHEPTNNPVL